MNANIKDWFRPFLKLKLLVSLKRFVLFNVFLIASKFLILRFFKIDKDIQFIFKILSNKDIFYCNWVKELVRLTYKNYINWFCLGCSNLAEWWSKRQLQESGRNVCKLVLTIFNKYLLF